MRSTGFFVSLALSISIPVFAAGAQQGVPSEEKRAQLARHGAAEKEWVVDADGQGAVKRIRALFSVAGATPDAKGADFIRQYGDLFNISPSMQFEMKTAGGTYKNGAPRAIAVTQTIHGFAAPGRGLRLGLDPKGNITEAAGTVIEGADAIAPPRFHESDAIAFARARLPLAGYSVADIHPGTQSAAKIIKFTDIGPRLVYKTSFVLGSAWTPLVMEIDSSTGETLNVYENRSTGTKFGQGTIRFNGQDIVFKTSSGKGNVYSTIKNALAKKHSAKPLAELGFETAGASPGVDGTLFGRYGLVVDGLAADAFSANHNFGFLNQDPLTADLFDQVNIYYWVETIATAYAKLFGPLPTDFAMPLIVNIPGIENAFFSPSDSGLGLGPGFMLFGDPSQQTGDFMDDYSRDMTVTGHEYLHAVADGMGLQFGAADIDNPPRAVNEAIADYFSASFFNDPQIGKIIAHFHYGPDLSLDPDAIRDLTELRVAPGDVSATLGQSGLPEEHEAGLIFGATLWRIRTAVKKAVADDAIADTLALWPQTTADVGFPTVDTNNAQQAYEKYFAACLKVVIDRIFTIKGTATGGKALGAALVNGAIGNFDTNTAYVLNGTAGLSLSYDSVFSEGVDNHAISLVLAAGRQVDITITGNGADQTQVDFTIQAQQGDFNFPSAKVVTGSNSKVSQKQMTVVNAGTYIFKIQNIGSGPGRYKLQIKVK